MYWLSATSLMGIFPMIEINSDWGRVGCLSWHNSMLEPIETTEWPAAGRWVVQARWGVCLWGQKCLTRGGWRIYARPVEEPLG